MNNNDKNFLYLYTIQFPEKSFTPSSSQFQDKTSSTLLVPFFIEIILSGTCFYLTNTTQLLSDLDSVYRYHNSKDQLA